MAKGKRKGSTAVDRAAEVIGHAVGSVAETVRSLQAEHPHPVEEAREALAAGQETLAAAASKAGTRAAAIIKKVKAVARRTKKAAIRGTRKNTPKGAEVTRAARKAANRPRKGRKPMKRAAGRLKR